MMALLLPSLGPMELVLILLIVLVVFGASRLPQLGKGLGEGIRNFKRGVAEGESASAASTDQRDESTKGS